MVFATIFRTIKRIVSILFIVVELIMAFLGLLLYLMLKIPFMCAKKIKKICFGEQRNDEDRDMKLQDWIQRNCEYDMRRWMDKHQRNFPTDHLVQLLSKTSQSQESFTNKVSCLSVVIFIRIATVALPNALGASLIHTLDETFGIIYFIDKKMNATDDDKNKLVMAKELWSNRNNHYHWFHNTFLKPLVMKLYSQSAFQPPLDLYFALWLTEELKRCDGHSNPFYNAEYVAISGMQHVKKVKYAVIEIQNVCELIIGQQPRQTYSSIDGLLKHMEQLFVDMLHFFLSQLPLAIFKHLVESPIQEREERARHVLKFLFKLEQLENKVNWSFPDGTGITSLITPQVPATSIQVHHSLVDGIGANSLTTAQVLAIDTQCIEPVEGNFDADDEIQELV